MEYANFFAKNLRFSLSNVKKCKTDRCGGLSRALFARGLDGHEYTEVIVSCSLGSRNKNEISNERKI